MNRSHRTLRITACCMAAAVTFTAMPGFCYAAPMAGISDTTAAAVATAWESGNDFSLPTSGVSLKVADYVTFSEASEALAENAQQEDANDSEHTSEAAPTGKAGSGSQAATDAGGAGSGSQATADGTAADASGNASESSDSFRVGAAVDIARNGAEKAAAKEAEAAEEAVSPYENIAIAQVDNYVNVRSAASEEGEVVGKLYNNSAATVEGEEDGWYKITSGNVTGYVKSDYVVCDDEELAKQVSRRVATVETETLFVRTEATTESDVLAMVPDQEDLTVTDESVDGWTKVAVEEGEGYVSNDYIQTSTEFVTAESKEEEEARLAKEEAEREAAAAAAEEKADAEKKSSDSGSSSGSAKASGSGGSAVASYACQFVGNPYVYGGASLTNGADCSGFVMAVYAAFGVSLPHSSSALQGVGYGVSLSDIQPGDIVCYSGHVAIYVGNNTIVHASTPESGIKYSSPIDYKPIITVRRIF